MAALLTNKPKNRAKVVAIILAGGEAQRLGKTNKALVKVADKTLVRLILERLERQAEHVLISSSKKHSDEFKGLGLPVFTDELPDFEGPISGIMTSFKTLERLAYDYEWLAVFSTDVPVIPTDTIERLLSEADDDTPLVLARSQNQLHYCVSLWRCLLYTSDAADD